MSERHRRAVYDILDLWWTEEDPRFADGELRYEHREEFTDLLEEVFQTRPAAEWVRLFEEAGVPSGPVNSLADAADDPDVVANDYITTLEHPDAGTLRVVGTGVHMSETQPGPSAPPPQLGEHTNQILRELAGYTDQEIKTLRANGVI